jgi:hypothetical protein
MNLLTPSRIKIYSATILATNFTLLLVSAWWSTNYQVGGDYQAFYNAGIIFNTQPHGRLYDLALQDALYESQARDSKGSLPFAYAPFFVLPCAVSARLPYIWAYLVWSLGSILLLCAGYTLVWRALDHPNHWYLAGLLAALAFPPFEFYTLLGGQTSAFGFFGVALAFFLQRNRREVGAGLALSLLLYKPPLLLLFLPMLAVTRQWRLLGGFVSGAAVLSLLSLLLVGTSGLAGYVTVLKLFYKAGISPTEVFQTWKYVDIGSALRLLTNKPPGAIRLAILILVFPFLYFAWRKIGKAPLSWGIAIAGTLLLNLYSPIYDCTLLIFSVMCAPPEKIGRTLLLVVFVLSFLTEPLARLIGFQIFTIILAYLMWHLLSPEVRPAIQKVLALLVNTKNAE